MERRDYKKVYAPRRRIGSITRVAWEHRLVAEKAIGKPLPAGAEVHHVDGDRTNNVGSNLVICENKRYHHLLHVRARVLALGGDPNTQRICCHCRKPVAIEGFHVRKLKTYNSIEGRCKECSNLVRRKEPVSL